ncbi:hypothetical protein AOLI_G00029130 [Acnodon oligacanthus]
MNSVFGVIWVTVWCSLRLCAWSSSLSSPPALRLSNGWSRLGCGCGSQCAAPVSAVISSCSVRLCYSCGRSGGRRHPVPPSQRASGRREELDYGEVRSAEERLRSGGKVRPEPRDEPLLGS